MKARHTMAVRIADRMGQFYVEGTLSSFPERVRQATYAWAAAHPQVERATLVVTEVGTLQSARVKISASVDVTATADVNGSA